jgi:hypothetical protein
MRGSLRALLTGPENGMTSDGKGNSAIMAIGSKGNRRTASMRRGHVSHVQSSLGTGVFRILSSTQEGHSKLRQRVSPPGRAAA